MGVVEGDVHDLGKNIVSAMLRGAGIRVVDIGVDLPARDFVEAVRRERPEILGIGAYMSSSMLEIPEVIQALMAAGLRDQIKILIGGVPISQAFAESVGADGWAPDALVAVSTVKELLAQDPKHD
jgi:5-methyltetrahydrofolate--homocysteine methyltransferase